MRKNLTQKVVNPRDIAGESKKKKNNNKKQKTNKQKTVGNRVGWLLGCLTSQQQVSVSQGTDLLRQFYVLPH